MDFNKVTESIDRLNMRFVDVWKDVCTIESPTVFKEGVDKVGKYFADLGKEYGFRVEFFPQDKVGDVVVISMNPESTNSPVSLSGHMDTVHDVGSFGDTPVRIEDGKIFGPGVVDCKGGIVAGFLAMAAMKECGFEGRPVQLLLQSDEENSSKLSNKATINYICERSKGSAAFLNLEGHEGYFDGKACLVRKGIARFAFEVKGVSAHASYCATDGASAILDAAKRIVEIEAFKDDEGVTCNCGTIRGGTLVNVVPESCVFDVDVRFCVPKELDDIEAKLREIADREFVKGCTCTMKRTGHRECMELMDRNAELLGKVNQIFCSLGISPWDIGKKRGGSDAAYAAQAGIPCLDSIGVKGEQFHSIKEWAELDSLAESAKRLAAIAMYL